MPLPDWTPCADELPELPEYVLVCNADWSADQIWLAAYVAGTWIAAGGVVLESSAHSGRSNAAPTHWMELPELPEKEAR